MDIPSLESFNLLATLPLLFLAGWAVLVLSIDLFIEGSKAPTAWLSMLGLAATGVLLLLQGLGQFGPLPSEAFQGMLVVDGFAIFLQSVVVISAAFAIPLAVNYLPRRNIERGEFYTLMLFSTTGMMLMAMASDMIVVFVALELLSIPLYILSGLARPNLASEEAAMKYFLLGAFASGFLVYGVALTYGGTGSTSLSGILSVLSGDAANTPLALVGLILILVGLSFKVAAVPFHMWTPDVYQGAPTPVTAFMSVGAKVGGFAAMLRVLITAMPSVSTEWGVLIAIMASLTMIIGNIIAISQSDIKRMLAYSSIAHAGYILLAVAAAQDPAIAPSAVAAAIFYLLTYTFTNLGAFAVVIALEKDDGTGTEIKDFAGLVKRRPWLAYAMAIFMFSLTGVPPTAGMVGKWFVFGAAINAAAENPLMLVAALIGVITTVASAFYYVRIILTMFMQEGEGEVALKPALAGAVITCAVLTFLVGIVPTPLFQFAQQALLGL